MSSKRELDEGIKSIKSAWRREHTARTNLEKMLEQTEAEDAKLVVKLNSEHIARQNVEIENVRLRELAAHYDSALSRLCDQMQAHVDCQRCVLVKDYDEDTCAIDELRDAARELRIEVGEC